MFEQAVLGDFGKTHRAGTTMLGMAAQAMLVATAAMWPVISPQTLPRAQALVTLFAPGAPAPPPPPAPAVKQEARKVYRDFQVKDGVVTAPSFIPEKAAFIEEPPLAADTGGGVQGGVQGGVPGGVVNGVLGSVIHSVPAVQAVAPPPLPVTPAKEKPADILRIRVGGQVRPAALLKQVIPVYPPLARQARISGDVQLMGVIGTDGRIRELQLVSGHPFLVKAAMDAVRQWLYQPTLLNGDPVEVIQPINVAFRLN
jgi:protein TonB